MELTDPELYGPGIATMLGDVQVSAQVVVAPDGTVSRNAHTPYGVTRASDELDTDRGWLGQVEDRGTGLTYLNARYCDPAIGRFLSPDPLMDPGDPRTLDSYRYAVNNPISYSDPTGLCPGLAGQGLVDCANGWKQSPGVAVQLNAAAGHNAQAVSPASGGSGNSSCTDAAKSGGQSHVNSLGGVANGSVSAVNSAMYLSGPNHFAGWSPEGV